MELGSFELPGADESIDYYYNIFLSLVFVSTTVFVH